MRFPFQLTMGNSDDLAAMISNAKIAGRIVWPCGVDRNGDWTKALQSMGYSVDPVEVYRQLPVPLPKVARDFIARGSVVIPLFSERSARHLHAELAEMNANIHPIAISNAVAEAFGNERAVVARKPTAAAMLDAIAAAYSTNSA